jgi:hypothetical protein
MAIKLIDWDNYEHLSDDEPLSQEMLQRYTEVEQRLEHVVRIIEKYRPKWQEMAVEAEIRNSDEHGSVYCELRRYYRGSCEDSAQDTFPNAYLMMPDLEIHALELKMKEQRDAELVLQKKREEENRLAQKRRELERLKQELGEA